MRALFAAWTAGLLASPLVAQTAGTAVAADPPPPALEPAEVAEAAAADSLEEVYSRADSARAVLAQPPGEYGGVKAMDIIRLPFQLFGATLTLGLHAVGIVYAGVDEFLINPAKEARAALEEADVHARVSSLGSRSWPGVILRYEGLAPFYAEAGYSLRQYEHYQAGVALGDSVLGGDVSGRYRRMRQLHFYGVGMDARKDDESDFSQDLATAGGTVWWKAAGSPLRLTAGAGWERSDVGRGWDRSEPDVSETFEPATLFGHSETTDFLRVEAGAELDRTHVRHLQTRGFSLAGSWQLYDGVQETSARFHRLAGDARLYLPANERQLVALRVLAEDRVGEQGRGVPFFHLARLGGDDGLRGYQSSRFQDQALLAGQLEWRYEAYWHPGYPNSRVEGFAFVDYGGVGPSLGSLHHEDFRTTPGMGLRYIEEGRSVGEVYFGFGGDDMRFGFEIGRTF